MKRIEASFYAAIRKLLTPFAHAGDTPDVTLTRFIEGVTRLEEKLTRVEEQLTLRTKELHAERARADMMSEVADKLFDVIAVLRRP